MSNIKFTNNVLLDYASVCGGLDPTNVLANTKSGNYTYTAVSDCFVSANINNYTGASGYIKVDDVIVMSSDGVHRDDHFSMSFILKKGQVLKCQDGVNRDWNDIRIFGLK